MRQGIFRALLVLALLAPLSRSSFADSLFVVSGGRVSGSVDFTSVAINSPFFTFDWTNGIDFGVSQDWTVGEYAVAMFPIGVAGPCGVYSDPDTGYECDGVFNILSAPFLIEASSDGGLDETGIPITWTAEIDAYYEGTLLYDIDMSGVGTLTLTGEQSFVDPGHFTQIGAVADLTGVGDISPEPNTLTLMGTGLIAFIFVIGFRRRYSDAKAEHHVCKA